MKSVEKPTEIVDRQREWEDLVSVWQNQRPELVFALGRRRVGKSFLLTRFANAVGGIYYQATQRTEAEQLAQLSRIVGRHFQDAALLRGVPFSDWEGLFEYLADRAGDRPLLLVLDEFPYLTSAAPALASIIQKLWDHRLAETRVKLVLSGSHITAMRRFEGADQPLYGRRTHRLLVQPFSYADVGSFVSTYSARDQLLAYGAFGGLPGHLALLDPKEDVAANVARTMLTPSGRMSDDAQHMLDAFVSEAEVHYSIIHAVATGDRTWSRITSRLGKSSGSLSRPMRWLEEMQVVRRAVPVTEKNPSKSKKAIYHVTDPYLAFWHRFVAPHVAAGTLGLVEPQVLWKESVAPYLNDYMGPMFEQACREYIVADPGERMPFPPLRVGSWWNHDGTEEVDVVALGKDGQLLVGECKWGATAEADLRNLMRRAELIAQDMGGAERVYYVLFSASSRTPQPRGAIAGGEVIYMGLDEMLERDG